MKYTCQFSFFCLSSILVLMLGSCYNQIALTGGPKDTTPPEVDTTVSTKNYQLRYVKDRIYLEFDEFISLKNPGRQIVVSPPLAYPLDVDHRGKKIEIKFNEDELLKDDATYIVNFGESIADFTENNLLKNYSFVFSTGDYIDSLELKGKVIDARTGEPIENITVMLYDDLADSIVYNDRPFYFAKTDDEGLFELKNLRADSFKIVALEDLNLNYLYEDNAERFGFLLDTIYTQDTTNRTLNISLFKKKSPPVYLDANVIHEGLIGFKFDQDLRSSLVQAIDQNLTTYTEVKKKEVQMWIKEYDRYPYSFAMAQDTLMDTISLRRPPSKERRLIPEIKIVSSNVSKESGLHPSDSLVVRFNIPLDSISIDKIFLQDSMRLTRNQINISEDNPKEIEIYYSWEEGSDYTISFDSSSIYDFFDRPIDSIGLGFEVGRRNSFGNIKLTFEDATEGYNYVVTLMQEDIKIHEWKEVRDSNNTLFLDRLPPDIYTLQIIEDVNGNRIWDPGDYLDRRYPEDIYKVELDALKENWILEETIYLSILGNNE